MGETTTTTIDSVQIRGLSASGVLEFAEYQANQILQEGRLLATNMDYLINVTACKIIQNYDITYFDNFNYKPKNNRGSSSTIVPVQHLVDKILRRVSEIVN